MQKRKDSKPFCDSDSNRNGNTDYVLKTERDSVFDEKHFNHKSFEKRLLEYNGKISVLNFEWGEPKGMEIL